MSIQSEIERISGNVQDTISAIQQTGVTVPEGANSDNLPSLAAALANEKQDKLTGTSGQFVGFDSGGNATAVAAPTAASIGALPTSGGTMTGSIKMGEHDITGTATNYGLFFDSMGQVIVKAGDSNSVEVTDMGVTIRSDVGITLNGSVSGISKSSVGLGNVDNTSDANKPISTATQTALNGKANTSHTHAAGDITSGTLPASRGGTGQTTLTPAVTTKGVRQIYAGTADMTAGTTALTTGCIYLVYE